ncbi:glycosyltransferase family 2 protein [Candidatus Roizmanbacteria bacterium]|nr:glycosyltransferase family 2 protein [Candidatus Roizmanbacteria bacterium]
MSDKLTSHFLTLIVPVYRQQKIIVRNLRSLKRVLEKIRYDYEIITVIDGAHDKSFENIKSANIHKVKCIAYNKNHGKSYAIRLGMTLAKGDYIMFIDSGMEIDPNGISMLLEHMEWYDADIIVGSKRHLASQVEYPFTRKILSFGYYYLVKLLFGIKVHDTQAGIKIFKKSALEKILPRLVEKKFAGDLEILVVAYSCGFKRIYEAPIRLNYHISFITSAATIKSILGILIDTFAIFYRKNILRYYTHYRQHLAYPEGLKIIKT